MMTSELLNEIIEKLNNVKIEEKSLAEESVLEQFLLSILLPIAKKFDKTIINQPKTHSERVQKPDISIGLGEILIEIKILTDINGLYRIFYQIVKYLKIAKETLILFTIDRKDWLKDEDVNDLLALTKKPKILKIIRRRQ